MTARASSRSLRLVALAALASVLGGCDWIEAPPTDDALGGMGLPTWSENERYDGEPIPFAAEVIVAENGCAYVEFGRGEMVALWPPGSTLSAPAKLPDGTEVVDGAIVEGLGLVVPFGALPGGAGGYWAHVTGFCHGDVPRALLLREVSEVR